MKIVLVYFGLKINILFKNLSKAISSKLKQHTEFSKLKLNFIYKYLRHKLFYAIHMYI